METDDGIRGANGVVLSLRELDGDRVRIIMDDVSNHSRSTKASWKHEVVVTWKDYEMDDLGQQRLSDEELAGLGAYVVARLVALKEHPHK